jgi:hypothetical protein
MQPPTILADSRLRTHLVGWGACTLVLGTSCLWTLSTYLDHLQTLSIAAPELAAEKFRHLALWIAAGLFLLTGGVAGLGSTIAIRILRAGQYPPPGLHVVRDTPLRTGRQARRVAFLLWTLLCWCSSVAWGSVRCSGG